MQFAVSEERAQKKVDKSLTSLSVQTDTFNVSSPWWLSFRVARS